jgi:hypothetical protein
MGAASSEELTCHVKREVVTEGKSDNFLQLGQCEWHVGVKGKDDG